MRVKSSENRSTWNTKSRRVETPTRTKWRKTAADQQLGVPRETPRASLWQHPRPLGCSTWNATESIAESAGVLTYSTWNARSLLTHGTPCFVPRGTLVAIAAARLAWFQATRTAAASAESK